MPALSFVTLVPVAQIFPAYADDFELSHIQRIACSRGLSAGKLNTATCKSYAYIFNTKTSEYFRCTVSLALTRDNKEVITSRPTAAASRSPASSTTISHYAFDATETEPPNTNSFFGPGGYAIWASDTTAQKVRGCITISSGARFRHLEVPRYDLPVMRSDAVPASPPSCLRSALGVAANAICRRALFDHTDGLTRRVAPANFPLYSPGN